MNINVPMSKTVYALRDYSFYIPAYQRGYRWTTRDVEALLDDIYEFDAGTDANSKKYCLQPLIVKKREDGSYEVVDGQQRLTTIFIYLQIAFNQTKEAPYQLTYETRDQSQQFLNSLASYSGDINDENIDYYHITNAYKTMKAWLDNKAKAKNISQFTVFTSLYNKIVNNVIFIWHEIPQDSNPVDIFTKVNVGKIRLSNAELIKALIFNKDNFHSSESEKEQQELSLAWNRIERGLHNDSLWLFLNDKTEYETRIDLIFSLISDDYVKEDSKASVVDTTEKYRTFLIFYEAYRSCSGVDEKQKFVKDLWRNVEMVYERFQEWYADLNKYHVIGYLISSGIRITDIFDLTNNKRKSEEMRILIDKTKIKSIESQEKLFSISYGANKLRNMLLLFNIATLVCKNERQYRFPFDLYKKDKWDIEHIHATADETEEADDNIGNLTLLSADINRSYQDDDFVSKRKEIIKRDALGKFIPLCTKNVFLKQYTENPTQMGKWSKEDKEDYLLTMWKTLDAFWEGDFLK